MDNMETMQGTEEQIIYRNDMKTPKYGDPVEVQGTDDIILEHAMKLTEEQNVAPSTAKNVDTMVLENKNTDGADKCVYNKRGMCGKHGKRGVGTKVSSKVWKDRGGGRGYGWVTRKVMKYRCIVEPSLSTERGFSPRSESEICATRNKNKSESEGAISGSVIIDNKD